MPQNNLIKPRVGISVFVSNHERQILLMKRTGSHGQGSWCPPGGKLELGEQFLDCAKREVREETDLEIEEVEILGVTNDIYAPDNHYVTVHTKAATFSGVPKIMEPNKCTQMAWFDLEKLPKPLFLSVENLFKSDFECLCDSRKPFKDCHGKNL